MSKSRVELYYVAWCGFCRAAKRLLDEAGVPYQLYDYTGDTAATSALKARTGHPTMPQVFIDGALIGGYTELAGYVRQHGIDALRPAG